jgi:beta-mannanase
MSRSPASKEELVPADRFSSRTAKRLATALPLLLLAVALVLAASSMKETSPAANASASSTGNSLVLGVWSGQPWEPENLDAVTRLLGRSPAVFLTYQSWSKRSFHTSDMEEIARRDAAHVVSWEPDGYTLKSIANGQHDQFIREWATGAAQWGRTIYLRPMHEMNGDWYSWGRGVNGNTAEEFVAAWRHIHDLFMAAGASNVQWVWSPNVRYGAEYPLADLYPGDAYVDWVGLDGYNWGSDPHLGTPAWQTFTAIFGATYNEIQNDVAPGKPMIIVETASTEHGGDKAAWIRQTFEDEILRFPKIRAVIWFNQADGPSDFRINSSPRALNAFKEVFTSQLYAGRLP